MSDSVKLTFINKSTDLNNSAIVIYQQNVAPGASAPDIAWHVLRDGPGTLPFSIDIPAEYEVGVREHSGAYSRRLRANAGDMYDLAENESGYAMAKAAGGTTPEAGVVVRSKLPRTAKDVCVFRGGKMVALQTGLGYQQKAAFRFDPKIFVAIAPDATEGMAIDKTTVPGESTELSLAGIASADVVITGGGEGPDAEPVRIMLENVQPR